MYVDAVQQLVVGRTQLAMLCSQASVEASWRTWKKRRCLFSCLLFADSGSITHWHWIKKWAVYNVDRNGSSQACQTIFCSLARSCQNRKLLFCFVGGFLSGLSRSKHGWPSRRCLLIFLSRKWGKLSFRQIQFDIKLGIDIAILERDFCGNYLRLFQMWCTTVYFNA